MSAEYAELTGLYLLHLFMFDDNESSDNLLTETPRLLLTDEKLCAFAAKAIPVNITIMARATMCFVFPIYLE